MADTLVFDFVEHTVALIDSTGEHRPVLDPHVELVGTASPPQDTPDSE